MCSLWQTFFPNQPLEDNCSVQAICSEAELSSWAKKQHNCIMSFTKDIYKGRFYFYKVFFNNEEATLSLKLNGNKVRKDSLLGTCNSEVTSGLKKVVNEWLRGKQNQKED